MRGLSPVAASGGHSSSRCVGLSCCGAQAPDARAQQLWLTGLVAPRHVGSSQTRARTRVPCIGRQILNHCATREALKFISVIPFEALFGRQSLGKRLPPAWGAFPPAFEGVPSFWHGHLWGQQAGSRFQPGAAVALRTWPPRGGGGPLEAGLGSVRPSLPGVGPELAL